MGPDCEGRGVSCDVAVGALLVPATVCWHVLLIVCLTATNCVTLIKLKQPDTLAVADYLAHLPRVPCLHCEECFHQIFIFVFHPSRGDTSPPVNKHRRLQRERVQSESWWDKLSFSKHSPLTRPMSLCNFFLPSSSTWRREEDSWLY